MRKSRLSWYKQSKLIELFVAGATARTAASIAGVNKTTAGYYFQRLRQLIYNNSEYHELLEGEVEAEKAISVVSVKVNVVVVQQEKCLYLGF